MRIYGELAWPYLQARGRTQVLWENILLPLMLSILSLLKQYPHRNYIREFDVLNLFRGKIS